MNAFGGHCLRRKYYKMTIPLMNHLRGISKVQQLFLLFTPVYLESRYTGLNLLEIGILAKDGIVRLYFCYILFILSLNFAVSCFN